jgi:hypothetical protein
MDGPDPWAHVRGCPWSSIAVDVPTDVGRETLRPRTLTGGLSAAKHLILRQEVLGSSRVYHLPDVRWKQKSTLVVVPVAWREFGSDLLAARVLPAGLRGGAQGMRSSLARHPSDWQPSRRAARRSSPHPTFISEAVSGPGGARDWHTGARALRRKWSVLGCSAVSRGTGTRYPSGGSPMSDVSWCRGVAEDPHSIPWFTVRGCTLTLGWSRSVQRL